MLDETTRRAHAQRNDLHAALLLGGLTALLAVPTWLIWGLPGLVVTGALVALAFALAPRLPPEVVMRMYGATRVDPLRGGQLTDIVAELARRADLPETPPVYLIPSMTLNAFATGTREHAAIGITEGLLRRLGMREIAGVLAHEISHIRNNDLWVMGVADVITRFTIAMSYSAAVLAFLNMWQLFVLGETRISWLAILILYLSPTASSLMQLGLSRAREYDADLEGAMLTGDPMGLAAALSQLERYTGRFWEDLMFPIPGRRIPQPSVLRTHPTTENRVRRLEELAGRMPSPDSIVVEQPMVTTVGAGPIALRPRYRFLGLWY